MFEKPLFGERWVTARVGKNQDVFFIVARIFVNHELPLGENNRRSGN